MDFNLDFNLVRSQKLLRIPQLKLALDILSMDSRELYDYIEDQLETNPALEEEAELKTLRDSGEEETEPPLEEPGDSLSLKQHLLIQLNTMHLDKTALMIGEYLIDNTDDSGYLKVELPEVSAFFNVPSAKVAAVLELLQSFDPPGVCARSLKECLLLQLKQLDEPDEDAVRVVEKYLHKIAAGDIASISEETGLSPERVRCIFNRVKGLEPRPGREFYHQEAPGTVSPDIIIRETNDGLQAYVNEEVMPDICISESFTSGIAHFVDRESGELCHEQVKSAGWLIKCLEQRKNIIYDIALKLLACEKEYFKDGRTVVKLDKEAFAASLNMHESILDKALNGKTLQCRWGIVGLDSFFQ